ncbi:Ldh family oxidoreductase [Microbispora sp. H10830]|uniref:Ldh family oxidoreductase n=1 Tax=Microbispora sp. H10830 TaxID=2729109 RepID=UPI0016023657|nr:Ldh family oxidoreductase [Microbispora sp. H10830]
MTPPTTTGLASAASHLPLVLELRDVVLSVGPPGAERVLLRGADLRIREGEKVLLSGLDGEARSSLTALLDGRMPPTYGTVRVGPVRSGRLGRLRAGRGTTVLDAGDGPGSVTVADLPPDDDPFSVLVLAGHEWAGLSVPGRYRSLRLDGGQFVESPPARPPAGVRVPLAELRRRTLAALLEAGVEAPAAEAASSVLVDAERRGHRSHGVALLPTYLRRIEEGGIRAAARPRLTEAGPAVATVDAGGGLGQPAARLAADWCAAKAAEHGLAAVAVHDNNHVGMLAAYRHAFQRHQVVGFLLNTSGPSIAAPGAGRPTLGSNAICLVTPSAEGGEPFCVDLATGVVAAGKIRDALNRGVPVPPGWLQDASGAPTTDPGDLDRGGSIPLFGGYKGLCVTLLAEILAGAVAGRRVSPDVGKQRKHPEQVMGCSQLFIGLSARHLGPAGEPEALDGFVDRLRAAVLDGHATRPARPWFPDQPEEDHAAEADAHGVEVPASVLAELGWGLP